MCVQATVSVSTVVCSGRALWDFVRARAILATRVCSVTSFYPWLHMTKPHLTKVSTHLYCCCSRYHSSVSLGVFLPDCSSWRTSTVAPARCTQVRWLCRLSLQSRGAVLLCTCAFAVLSRTHILRPCKTAFLSNQNRTMWTFKNTQAVRANGIKCGVLLAGKTGRTCSFNS